MHKYYLESGFKKLADISGDGVKNYYREKFGFENII